MKNTLLALVGAATLASCAAGAPAYARDNGPARWEHSQERKWEHRRDNRRRYDNRRYHHQRVYRSPNYYSWQYYRYYPSYIYGRCDPRWNVRAVDEYTGRIVCLPRHVYERYYNERYGNFSIRINL